MVKIGYTCTTLAYRLSLLRMQYRLSDLVIVAAVKVAQYTRSLEQSIHHVLKPQRIKGEWFYLHMDQATLEAIIQEALPRVFGQRLRQYRELADLSQNELAKRSGVPRPTITNVESGEQVGLTLENARKLARALGISIDMLAGKGEESEMDPALAL